jgi:hypothetical protein
MNSSLAVEIGLFVLLYWWLYGRKRSSSSPHSCNCNNSRTSSVWNEVRGTQYQPVHPSDINDRTDVYGNGFLSDPTPRQLGLSTGVISGRACTPHQAVAEIELLQFRRSFGRNPDSNEYHPGVWTWATETGGSYTTTTRDGSGPRTFN